MVWNTVFKETSKMRKDGNLALSLNCISQGSSNKLTEDRESSTNDDLGGDIGVVGEVEGMTILLFSSVQFSHSVMSYSLRPHEPQHARPPCPSPTPRVHSKSCLLSRWCHPAISSSVVPFSSCPQSLPASESFPMSQLFAGTGVNSLHVLWQSTGVSALALFLPKKSQGWSPLEWTGWISLRSKGLSRVFSNTTVQILENDLLNSYHVSSSL